MSEKNNLSNLNCLAVFDFDGTITTTDTFNDFLIYNFGLAAFLKLIIFNSGKICGYKLGLVNNAQMKTALFHKHFENMNYAEFLHRCSQYADKRLPGLLNEKSLEKIEWHLSLNHEVIIISASPREWIWPWALRKSISRVIATEVEVLDGFLTGRIPHESNYHGDQKVSALKKARPDFSKYYIFAYGDSRHDRHLFNIANETFYRKF